MNTSMQEGKMSRSLLIFIAFSILLSACAPATQSTPLPVFENATSSPLPTTTTTHTALPSDTPTASITPLPTISTFTPTFDFSTIVTVTPAPQAECPKENSTLSFSIKQNPNYPIFDTQEILDLLNKGASFKAISNAINNSLFKPFNTSQDITGDKIPEILFINLEPMGHFYIFACAQGQYILYSPDIGYFGFDTEIITVKDLNSDDIPEIILQHRGCSGNGCYSIYILEWNGSKFQVMNSDPKYGEQMDGLINVEMQDLNNDGDFEFMMTGGIPAIGSYIFGLPWRLETKILSWNGTNFALESIKYASPEFRFQTIQDGDRVALAGNFDEAIKTYQDAISNDKLDWWSSQRQTDTIIKLGNEGYSTLGTPAPGIPDATEYPRLAAYAYYRIMLLHLVQGNEPEASTTYNTLQETFGNDQYGSPYVEMATAFWNAYQSTHKMYDGCAAAIQYAVEHPEILIPLGSDYHGAQSHIYKPEDVCPFR
jgi:hypothetical protein